MAPRQRSQGRRRTRRHLVHELARRVSDHELGIYASAIAFRALVALIPLVYGRSMAFVKPRVHGWWEFGKTSASFADLRVDE